MKGQSNINLRDVREKDIPFLIELFTEAVVKSCSSDYSQEQIEAWIRKGRDPLRWKERFQSQYFILAKNNSGKYLGFSSLRPDGYLDMMFVAPESQCTGVATRLLNRVKKKAIQLGHTQIDTHASITARYFFERNGFHVVALNHTTIFNVRVKNYRMKWVYYPL